MIQSSVAHGAYESLNFITPMTICRNINVELERSITTSNSGFEWRGGGGGQYCALHDKLAFHSAMLRAVAKYWVNICSG